MLEKLKAFLDREKKLIALKKENEVLRGNSNEEQIMIDAVVEKNNCHEITIKRLEDEKQKLIDSIDLKYIKDWQRFMQVTEFNGIGMNLVHIEATAIFESQSYPPGFMTALMALGEEKFMRPLLVDLCYMIAMKGRMDGKPVEYSEALIKFVEIVTALRVIEMQSKSKPKPKK